MTRRCRCSLEPHRRLIHRPARNSAGRATPSTITSLSAPTQPLLLNIRMAGRLASRTLARVPTIGEIRQFSGGPPALFGHLRENRRGQRRSAAACAFSAGTWERRPASAQAAPGPPAASGCAWRTCASRACGSCFPGGRSPRPPRGRSCHRPCCQEPSFVALMLHCKLAPRCRRRPTPRDTYSGVWIKGLEPSRASPILGIFDEIPVEPSFPVFSWRAQPDVLFRLVVLSGRIVAAPSPGGANMDPSRGPVDGAGVARGLDEGFDEHGRGVVALGPVAGKAARYTFPPAGLSPAIHARVSLAFTSAACRQAARRAPDPCPHGPGASPARAPPRRWGRR